MDQQRTLLDRQKGRSLLWTLIVAGLVTTMNTTTVSIALPSYMQIFHVDLATVQWVVVGYMLPLGMMMPLSGYLGERLGYRRTFLMMMTAIGICSLGCALAWNFQMLVFWRVLKGIAAGIVTPYSMSLLYRYIGHDLQPHYLGIATMMQSFGVAVGPALSGLLLQFASWRMLFLVNLPLVVLAILGGLRTLPKEAAAKTQEPIDLPGIVLVTAGTGAVLIGFTYLETWGAHSLLFWGTVLGGLGLVMGFIWRQLHTAHPLLNFAVLRYRPFAVALVVNCVLAMTMGINGILNMLYMQNLLGYTPFAAGLMMLIPSLALLGGTWLSDRLFGYATHRTLVVAGLFIAAAGNFGMSLNGLETTAAVILFALCLRYIGLGLVQMPLADYGMSGIDSQLTGHASALFNWGRQTVTVVSTNILTIVLSLNITRYWRDFGQTGSPIEGSLAYQQASMSAIDSDYRYLAIALLASVGLALLVMRRPQAAEK